MSTEYTEEQGYGKEPNEKLLQLNKYHEVIKRKNFKGEELQKELQNTLDYVKEEFPDYIKSADGSRCLQCIYRRGNESIRNQFLDLLLPIIFQAATTKYQYHVVLRAIKYSNKAQTDRIFRTLFPDFRALIRHRIGIIPLNALYDKLTDPVKKNELMFSICWDSNNGKNKLKYEDVEALKLQLDKDQTRMHMIIEKTKELPSKIKGKNANQNTLESALKLIDFVSDKNGSKYKVLQDLILEVGKENPDTYGRHLVHINDFAFTREGSELAITCIRHAKPGELRGAIKLIEPHERRNTAIMPGVGSDDESDEQNEDEENEEGAEENVEEEDGNESEVELNNTAKLATDEFGWRVLACALSFCDESAVVVDEVLGNLLDFWPSIRASKYVHELLVRLLVPVGSVFNGVQFQRESLNEEIASDVAAVLVQFFPDALNDFVQDQKGSRIVAELLRRFEGKEEAEAIAAALFTRENLSDAVAHKAIRTAAKEGGADCAKKAKELVEEVGLADVLRTPGAWVVAELCGNDKKLRAEVDKVLEAEKAAGRTIEGKAIDAIVSPMTEEDRKKIAHRRHQKSALERQAKNASRNK